MLRNPSASFRILLPQREAPIIFSWYSPPITAPGLVSGVFYFVCIGIGKITPVYMAQFVPERGPRPFQRQPCIDYDRITSVGIFPAEATDRCWHIFQNTSYHPASPPNAAIITWALSVYGDNGYSFPVTRSIICFTKSMSFSLTFRAASNKTLYFGLWWRNSAAALASAFK